MEKTACPKSQTKAEEIKGKGASTLKHAAIVQQINEAEQWLLGKIGPCDSNMPSVK